MPEPFFETRDDWLRHEQGQHNLEWICDGLSAHAPLRFTTRKDFEAHFTALHPAIFTNDEIVKLAGISARPSVPTFKNCPFCDFQCSLQEYESSQSRLENHILDHILALFMMALPERNDIPDAISSDSNSHIKTVQDSQSIGFISDDPDYIDPENSSISFLIDDNLPETSSDIWDSVKQGRLQGIRILFLGLRDRIARLTNSTSMEGNFSNLGNKLGVLLSLLELWIQHLYADEPLYQESLVSPELEQIMPHQEEVTLELPHMGSDYTIFRQLEEVGRMADEDGAFKEDQLVKELIDKVYRLSLVVHSMLKNQFNLFNRENGQITIETKVRAELKESVIRWLSSLDFLTRQEEIFNDCLDTSQWLLESEEFQVWSSGGLWALHCEGEPGVGKVS